MNKIHRAAANTVATIAAVLAAGYVWAQGAQAVPTSAVDAAALQSIAKSNMATALALEGGTCAAERQAVNAAAAQCKDSACVIALAAISALTPCSVVTTRNANANAQAAPAAPTIINAAGPPPTVGERVLNGLGWGLAKLFDVGMALGPSYMNMRLGTTQSNNSTALAMRQSDNGLAATQSTNNTFAAFGANLQGTATAGFTQLGTVGVAAATTPKTITNVTGNGNAVNGSTITNTTDITCPGGQGGNGQGGNGSGAPGGAGNGAAGGLTGCTGTTGQ